MYSHPESDIFKGIGKLKDVKVKIHVDENGIPVIQRIDVYPFIFANKWKPSSSVIKN
jgi:hypothetical protein